MTTTKPCLTVVQLGCVLVFLFGTAMGCFGQNTPKPSNCVFEESFGLLTDSTGNGKRFIKDRSETDVYRIYNDDGTLWYAIAIHENNPLYFRKNPKSDFKPIMPVMPSGPSLRLVGESEYWYKVIVNEETKTAKFVLRSDPFYMKENWETAITMGGSVRFDYSVNPLREQPDGRPIKGVPEDLLYVQPYEIKGEWIFVNSRPRSDKQRFSGWVRWRKGNELLLRFWISDNFK
ncbi:MAG: hypothetical protein IPN69_14570 [Acidobacteria bacterium]|nr:hypothetical protein [Acidobacteriota bacterium]